jgi:PKD repeat protein
VGLRDGLGNATTQNPLHAFPVITDGCNHFYTITMTATNGGGSDTHVVGEYITVKALPPVADFAADRTIVINGDSVQFTDASTNAPQQLAVELRGRIGQRDSEESRPYVPGDLG